MSALSPLGGTSWGEGPREPGLWPNGKKGSSLGSPARMRRGRSQRARLAWGGGPGGPAQSRPGCPGALRLSSPRPTCFQASRAHHASLPPVNKAACESFMGLYLKIDEMRPLGPIPRSLQWAGPGPRGGGEGGRGLPARARGAWDVRPRTQAPMGKITIWMWFPERLGHRLGGGSGSRRATASETPLLPRGTSGWDVKGQKGTEGKVER